MTRSVRIKAGLIETVAELNETKTAKAIWEALPIKGYADLWGEEIYFSIPVRLELETGQELVDIGDLGYWPQGNAFCIFFGPTPISRGRKIRPTSAVTVFGRVIGDAKIFKKVSAGTEITIRRESNE